MKGILEWNCARMYGQVRTVELALKLRVIGSNVVSH